MTFTQEPPFKTAAIKLACGCTIRRRDTPASRHQRFLCESGAGHGYREHPWVSWEYDGRSDTNPRFDGVTS